MPYRIRQSFDGPKFGTKSRYSVTLGHGPRAKVSQVRTAALVAHGPEKLWGGEWKLLGSMKATVVGPTIEGGPG